MRPRPKVKMRKIGTPSSPAYRVFLGGLELGLVEKAFPAPNVWGIYRVGSYTFNGHFRTARTRAEAVAALLHKPN